MFRLSLLLLPLLFLSLGPGAQALDLTEVKKNSENLGYDILLSSLPEQIDRPVRIALFDIHFDGYEDLIGKELPQKTYFYPGSEPSGSAAETNEYPHGLFMAKILFAYMTEGLRQNSLDLVNANLELHLFSASGFTNFEEAISKSIELDVDLILQTTVRDFGSNFDGVSGVFNKEVSRATDAGITWINAAGNYGQSTYNLKNIKSDEKGWVKLPGPHHTLPIECTPIKDRGVCPIRLTLSWNDFNEDIELGTTKDLDFGIYELTTNNTFHQVVTAELTQKERGPLEWGESLFPREIIEFDLKKGRYFIRVQDVSQNFGPKDQLRIVSNSDAVRFEYFDVTETLLNPADHPDVITIGASDTLRSSRSLKLEKPEISLPSLITLKDNTQMAGTSTAAAIAAAGMGLVKFQNPGLGRQALIKKLQGVMDLAAKSASHLKLGFQPTVNKRCFSSIEPMGFHDYVYWLAFDHGAHLVRTTDGAKLALDFDPAELLPDHLYYELKQRRLRGRFNDMILVTPRGYQITHRQSGRQLPIGWYEIFQGRVCN